MDWMFGHTDLIAGGLAYVLWEFWLGKTKLIRANSTVELILEIAYKVIGKILGKADAQAAAAAPTQLSDADKASGQQ